MADQSLVHAYYAALDDHDYGALAGLLAPSFVQHRPDRTFSSRDAFVDFMANRRPAMDTTHDVRYVTSENGECAAHGRVVTADGDTLLRFVDVFRFDGDRITSLTTYVHPRDAPTR